MRGEVAQQPQAEMTGRGGIGRRVEIEANAVVGDGEHKLTVPLLQFEVRVLRARMRDHVAQHLLGRAEDNLFRLGAGGHLIGRGKADVHSAVGERRHQVGEGGREALVVQPRRVNVDQQ